MKIHADFHMESQISKELNFKYWFGSKQKNRLPKREPAFIIALKNNLI